jgi:hypothetical protein
LVRRQTDPVEHLDYGAMGQGETALHGFGVIRWQEDVLGDA